MVEQLLTLRINELHNIDDGGGNSRLKKNVSFNTDDDDSVQLNDSQHISDNESVGTKSSSGVSRSEERTRSLLSLHSPSIDSINDLDGLAPDAPLAEKIKKKKHRRLTEQKQEEVKKAVPKSPPWYTRVDLLKPLGYVALIVLLYLAWTKRDVWIPRMLTSNSRIRHIAIANEEKLQEKGFNPPATSSDNTNSTKSDSDADDDDDDDDDKGSAKKTSGQTPATNADDNAQFPPSKRPTPQKLNIRTRRNKMSFSKERGDKKRQRVRYSTVDGDGEDDDDVDIDGAVESDQTDADKKVKDVEPTVSTRHRRSRDQSHKSSRTKTAVVSLPVDPVVEQLRLLVSSRRKHPELLAVLAKQTGLKKDKVKQLIEKGNFRAVSVDKLVSIVNSYDSSLLTASE